MRPGSIRRLSGSIGVLLIASSIAACGDDSGSQSAADQYDVGAVLLLSGFAQSTGLQMRDGVEAAAKQINDAGGIDGKPLEIHYEDNQGLAKPGVDALNKLATVDDVPVSIVSSSDAILASLPIADREQVLLVNPGAQSPNLLDVSPFLVTTIVNVIDEVDAAVAYLREQGHDTISFVGLDNALGHPTAEYLEEAWTEAGGTFGTAHFEPVDVTDHSSVISKLKSEAPDVIYSTSSPAGRGSLIQQGGRAGLDVPIMSYSAGVTPEVIELGGKSAEGLLATTSAFDLERGTEADKQLLDAFGGKTPPFYTTLFYNATMMVAQAIEHTAENDQPFTGEAVADAVKEIGTFELAGADVTIREDGSASQALNIMQVKNGEFQVSETVQPPTE